MSLARRVTVLVLAMSLVSSALTFVFVVGVARQGVREAAAASLDREVVLLARVVGVTSGGRLRPGLGVDAVQQALATRSVTSAVVPLAGGGGPLPAPFTATDVAVLASGDVVRERRRGGARIWLVAGRAAGDSAVLVAQPLDVATSFVPAPRRSAMLAATIAAGIAAVGGVLLARTLSSPLVRLAAAARQLAAGERGMRVEPGGTAEIADVGRALNALSDALATSEDRQRRFLLTVSHELRTPLTAVSGYAEALADEVITGGEVPTAGRVIRDEAGRLQRRVEELLALARLEADDVTVDVVDVDVVALVRTAYDAWAARALAQGVRLLVEVSSAEVWARADPERLRQCVDALTDNAMRVIAGLPVGGSMVEGSPTDSRGPVVLAARQAGTDVVVEVRDGGPGLTPEDLAVAFEPGVLNERYRGQRPVGSGVGLALVGRLAALMGGRASAARAPEGGLAVGIVLRQGAPTTPSDHGP